MEEERERVNKEVKEEQEVSFVFSGREGGLFGGVWKIPLSGARILANGSCFKVG